MSLDNIKDGVYEEKLKSIYDIVKSGEALTVREILEMAIEILTVIELSHDMDIIIKDISEYDIYRDCNNHYNFAEKKTKENDNESASLRKELIYIAPEVYNKESGYSKSSDLYALGMLIYRLLNHNRNPFLPKFPKPYFYADEELSLNKRMESMKAEYPDYGGSYIGKIVVKSISAENERFASAKEFRLAIEDAQKKTVKSILDMNVNFFNGEVLKKAVSLEDDLNDEEPIKDEKPIKNEKPIKADGPSERIESEREDFADTNNETNPNKRNITKYFIVALVLIAFISVFASALKRGKNSDLINESLENKLDESHKESTKESKKEEKSTEETKDLDTSKEGKWIKTEHGYWYEYSDGTYPADESTKIDGIVYKFNKDGYVLTGWQHIDGKYYYYNDDLKPVKNKTIKIDGKEYKFDNNGVCE